ncbi:MAG: L-threonylcarbamoyladenylate synthase [Cyanobacteria bacterium J06627_28]
MPQVSLDEMVKCLAGAPALVSFPTDTVPALSTRPAHANLIFAAKQRPPEKPLILMGASFSHLRPYIEGTTFELETWQALTEQYWPGQLTLVLPASDRTPKNLNPLSTGTLGIRVPNHPTTLAILAKTGPLATTSANLSGQPPLTTQPDIAETFPSALTLAPSAYTTSLERPAASGKPSTVAQWTDQRWKILRQGEIYL